MGLGKTIQSITLLSEIYAAGVQGPFLVIAPLSTITNWEREFSTWTNMNAIVYHGSLASRQMIQQYEMYCKDEKVACWSVMMTLAVIDAHIMTIIPFSAGSLDPRGL